jgi:hypothetical protein
MPHIRYTVVLLTAISTQPLLLVHTTGMAHTNIIKNKFYFTFRLFAILDTFLRFMNKFAFWLYHWATTHNNPPSPHFLHFMQNVQGRFWLHNSHISVDRIRTFLAP